MFILAICWKRQQTDWGQSQNWRKHEMLLGWAKMRSPPLTPQSPSGGCLVCKVYIGAGGLGGHEALHAENLHDVGVGGPRSPNMDLEAQWEPQHGDIHDTEQDIIDFPNQYQHGEHPRRSLTLMVFQWFWHCWTITIEFF